MREIINEVVDDSKSVTPEEMVEILKRCENHLMKGVTAKYINFDADLRTGGIWRVTFRHWFGKEETTFTNTNRPIEERQDLFVEIMAWLDKAEKEDNE